MIQTGFKKNSARWGGGLYKVIGVVTSAVASLALILSVSVFALPPSTPTNLQATAGFNEVDLAWTAPDDDGGSPIVDYIIEYSIGGVDEWTPFDDGESADTEATVTGLTVDTEYDFRVSAVNEDQDTGGPSSTATATVLNPAPGAPTSLQATAGNGEVSLSWTAPAWSGSSEIIDYIVEYSLSGQNDWVMFSDDISTDTTSVVVGLSGGSAYDFRVFAANDTQTSPASATSTATPYTTPGSPTSVSAVRGNTEAIVSFTAPASNGGSSITSYTVTSNPGGITASGASSPITVTGLANGTAYTFTVIATNVAGDSELSEASNSVTPATTPDAPLNLSATGAAKEATLTWEAPASNGESITGYVVEYSVAGEDDWQVFSSGSLELEETVTSLADGTSYDFRVAAVNAVGQGDYATSSASTFSVPDAPTSVSASPGNGQAVVSFTAPASDGGSAITNYTVTSNPGGITASGASSPITVTGLANGTAYTFTVVAINEIGNSADSAASNSVTPRTVPGAPTGLTLTPTDQAVQLSWTAPVSNGGADISDYIVDYKPSSDSTWVTFSDGESTDTETTITGLTNGTSYDFRVSAVNIAGAGSYSDASSATPRTTPGSPTSVSAVRGNTEATVSFTAPVSDGGSAITSYTVTSTPGGITASGASSPITVTGLTNGTSYTFTVVATNAAGDSDQSEASNSVTPATVPGAPTGVSALAGNEQATVSFTAPASNGGSAITSYTVTSTPGGIAASGASSPITVTGLSNGTSYTFTVVATNDVGDGPTSSASSSVTPRTIPGAPTSVSAVAGNEEATISFTAPASNGGSAITSYTVTSSPGGITASGASSPITVTGLANGTAYTFTVVATNVAGDSDPSGASNSVTPAAVPDAPAGLAATPGSTQVDLIWEEPNDNGSDITDYIVQFKASPDSTWTTFSDGVSVSTSATVTGLTNGTQYDFRVAALSDVGTGSYSSTATSTPRTTPGVPTGVNVAPGNEQAELTWSAPASDGGSAITDYTVQYRESGEGVWKTFIDEVSASTGATVTGLDNGVSYDFRVAAVNEAGTGSYSSTATTTPRTTPGSPTSVSAIRGNTEATVSFTAPASDGGSSITSYTVTSSPGGITSSGASSPITVTGLTNGTAYTFTVIATNAAGDSDQSEASNSVTPATVPGAPTGVLTSAGVSQVELSWLAPASNGGLDITDYVIEYKISTDSTWTTFADGTSSSTNAIVTELTNGAVYEFRVSAVNEVGPGAFSDSMSSVPRTVPGAPTGLQATPGNSQIALSWTAPASNGGAAITDYVIEYSISGEDDWTVFADGTTAITSATVTGLTNLTAYDFRVSAVNVAGVGVASATVAATPDLTYTVISNIKTISTANSLTITWKTDVPSDSKVEYGPDTSYGNITTVSQTEGVTDHSVTITNLASCVTYSFRVISQPVTDGGFTTSENNVASTAGCAGDTMVIDEEVAAVPKDDGGIVTLAEGDRSLTVDIPAGYTDSDTVIQLKKLSEAPTNTTGVPTSGLVAVAGQVYEIKAVLSDGTLVTEFDQPITITVQYTDSDVADIDESSLSIYNWHDGAWVALTDCVVDQDVNTVTCTTTSFSLFVLFGEAVVVDKEEDDDEAEDKGSDSDIDKTTDADQKDSGSGSGTTSPPVVTPTDDADGEEDADTETPGEQTRDDEQEDEAEDNSNGIFTWLWIAGAAVAIAIIVALSIKRQRRNAQWQ